MDSDLIDLEIIRNTIIDYSLRKIIDQNDFRSHH